MTDKNMDVYVICRANDVAPGEARGFSLFQCTETGEEKPMSIVVIRVSRDNYVGYLNSCPHQGKWLNIGSGEFLTKDRSHLRCGMHGALFDIETGRCVGGPCKDESLEPIALAVIGGDLCICGVKLAEEDGIPDPFEDLDDTMEIMIHPD